MRTFMRYFVFLPIALLFLAFAVANRHLVNVRLDPFAAEDAAAAVSMPLFILILSALILGILIGGLTVWFSQGKFRKSARLARVEADRLRNEALNTAKPVTLPVIAPH